VNAVNGTEALRVTTLVPANATRRVIAEGGSIGQYRLEIDATGTQSYFLNVMQAKSAAGAELDPQLVDNGSSYTVILNGSVSITFNKGASSEGGSITMNGATTNFRSNVQDVTVSQNEGPVWAGAGTDPAAPRPPSNLRIVP